MVQASYSRNNPGSRRGTAAFGAIFLAPLCLSAALACACGGSTRPSKGERTAQIEAPVRRALLAAEEAESRRAHLEAERHYEQAVTQARNASSRALAHREFASTLAFWGEEERALEHLEASLEADPGQARVWHDAGILRSELGRPVQAQRALEEAVRLAPRDPRPRIALAALLVNRGSFEDALGAYESLLRLSLPPRIEKATRRAIHMLRIELKKQGES